MDVWMTQEGNGGKDLKVGGSAVWQRIKSTEFKFEKKVSKGPWNVHHPWSLLFITPSALKLPATNACRSAPSGKTLLALTWLRCLSCLKLPLSCLKYHFRQLSQLSQVKARSVFPDASSTLSTDTKVHSMWPSTTHDKLLIEWAPACSNAMYTSHWSVFYCCLWRPHSSLPSHQGKKIQYMEHSSTIHMTSEIHQPLPCSPSFKES